ncbi:MAG: glycosyltransferase [Elusimicrobiota bacterium]
MNELKILVIGSIYKNTLADSRNNLIETLLSNNSVFIDIQEIYNKYGFYGTHAYLTDYIKKNEINSVIYVGVSQWEFYLDISFFEKLRKDLFLVMETGDAEYYYETIIQYYAQAMDLVIVDDFVTPYRLRQIGINSLFYYSYLDTTHYYKKENVKKDIDVSFVGTITGRIGRSKYINYLLKNGINIKTFGWDSDSGVISQGKKIEIFNRSKINLNLTGLYYKSKIVKKNPIKKRIKGSKGTLLEVLSCGGFVLSEYYFGLENLFEFDKEIVIFRTKEELLEKVKYYLQHEAERENIAKRGHQRVIKDYNVKLAVPKLLATIDELRKEKVYRPSEIFVDDEFIKNYTTFRVLLILRFIKAGKWKFAFEELKIALKYRKFDWYQIHMFFIEEIFDSFPKIKLMLKIFLGKCKK